MGIVRIPLTSSKYPGRFAVVDEEDYARVSQNKWRVRYAKGNFYAFRTRWINGAKREIQMHRVILDAPDELMVDHRDGNGLNNTRENLRLCTSLGNARNSKARRDNPTGYKGVRQNRRNGTWIARISHNGKRIQSCGHDDPISAAHAYDAMAVRYFGEFARLNFPDEGGV